MRAAVLGSPIAHSLSPVLHRAAYRALGLADWSYEAMDCDEARLPALLAGCGPGWAGLSLTMPLKRAVLPLLDLTDPLAREVGAANTVVFAAGERHGHNTDVPGMITALTEAGITGAPATVLILGGGATACSALAAVRGLGAARATAAVRDPARAADLLAAAGGWASRSPSPLLTSPPLPLPTCSYRPSRPAPAIFMRNGYRVATWCPGTCSTWSITRGPRRSRPRRARPG